jgi:hypothetical protein
MYSTLVKNQATITDTLLECRLHVSAWISSITSLMVEQEKFLAKIAGINETHILLSIQFLIILIVF